MFDGPCVSFVDNRFDYGEERWIALGLLAERLVTIAHAPRGVARYLQEEGEST